MFEGIFIDTPEIGTGHHVDETESMSAAKLGKHLTTTGNLNFEMSTREWHSNPSQLAPQEKENFSLQSSSNSFQNELDFSILKLRVITDNAIFVRRRTRLENEILIQIY